MTPNGGRAVSSQMGAMRVLRRIWRSSIWHPSAIPPEEFKYRNLKRIWLPLYDLTAVAAGVGAILYGSNMLNRLFSTGWVDALGSVFTMVAILCLISISFPRLWALEIIGKTLLVGMIAGYITMILLFSHSPTPQLFIASVLAFGLPLAMFRLNLLGEEVKQRRMVAHE